MAEEKELAPAADAAADEPAESPAPVDSAFVRELNDVLASTYDSINELEQQLLKRGHGLDVTVSESRLIEAVGDATLHTDHGMSVTAIAAALDIRVPSATSAVNRLVRKGLLQKQRSERDARCVDVTLAHDGEMVYRLHRVFHRKMAEFIAADMTQDEQQLLLKGIRRLEQFYSQAKEG